MMKHIIGKLALMIAAATLGSAGSTASAQTSVQGDYFLRPYVMLGNGVIDGYQQNGATQASVNFANIVSSEVDLPKGVARTFLNVSGPNVGGSGTAQAAGIFGDRITFFGGAGTPVNFTFAFDGSIDADSRTNPNSTLQIGIFANLYVFEAGAGATYQNFTSLPGALIGQSRFLDFSNPDQDLDLTIDELLSGNFALTSGQTYDIFGGLSIFAATNDNNSNVLMDFTHTGRFGIDAAPGVTFASASGVFLGSNGAVAAVPEPATWAMMLIGFGLIGGTLRRVSGAIVAIDCVTSGKKA